MSLFSSICQNKQLNTISVGTMESSAYERMAIWEFSHLLLVSPLWMAQSESEMFCWVFFGLLQLEDSDFFALPKFLWFRYVYVCV